MLSTLRKPLIFISTFLGIFMVSVVVAFAAPFLPAETLDPGCSPGDVDCEVEITEIERSTGVPSSTPTSPQAILYINETNGDAYTWDGTQWNLIGGGGGGTPAGSDGQIQYNNSGAFGAEATLFWDDTNDRLGVGTSSPSNTIDAVSSVSLSSTTYQPDDVPGLDDATFGGTYTGAPGTVVYTVEITATGTPDQFDWEDSLGNSASGVDITGAAQTLSNGITITFGATTGHTESDRWTATVSMAGTVGTADYHSNGFFFASQDPITGLIRIGQDTGSPTPAPGEDEVDSIFIGRFAGFNAASGSNGNIFLGPFAGLNTTTGSRNTFIGNKSGNDNEEGSDNTFIGDSTAEQHLGSRNIAIGSEAGVNVIGGSGGIFIGPGAGAVAEDATVSNAIVVGSDARVTADRQLVLGGQDDRYIDDVYFGGGVTTIDSATPTSVTVQVTGADPSGENGSDIAGASLTLAGGKATGNATGGSLVFATSDAGASGTTLQSITEKVRVDAATGYLVIGGSAVNADAPLTASRTTDGDVGVFTDATGTCRINPTTSPISCASDERLKSNILSLQGSTLDALNELNPVTFEWSRSPDAGTQIGFIAQNIAQVFPTLVSEGPDGYLSLNQIGLISPIVKSIQELDDKIESVVIHNDIAAGDDTTLVEMVGDFLASSTEKVINGLREITSKKVVAEEELCIGETCITEQELLELLGEERIEENVDSSSGAGSNSVINDSSTQQNQEDEENQEGIDEEGAPETAVETDQNEDQPEDKESTTEDSVEGEENEEAPLDPESQEAESEEEELIGESQEQEQDASSGNTENLDQGV